MSNYGCIKEVVEDVFKDDRPHKLSDVRIACKTRGINLTSDDNSIHNIIFYFKKRGYLENTGVKGEYVRVGSYKKEENEQILYNEKEVDLDWSEFFVLEPEKGKYMEHRITFNEKGEIRLNSSLQKKINSNDIQIILSKNLKTILLNPGTGKGHRFTKAGTTKNREYLNFLRKLKIAFPIVYVVKWDEHYQMWKGDLKIEPKK